VNLLHKGEIFLLAILNADSTSDTDTLMNATMHLKGKHTGLLKK